MDTSSTLNRFEHLIRNQPDDPNEQLYLVHIFSLPFIFPYIKKIYMQQY